MIEYLSKKERKILAALFKHGRSFISDIAKVTLINRTTLYPILNGLLEKGVVTKCNIEETVAYEALSQKEFESWVARKQQEAKQTADTLIGWAKQQHGKNETLLHTDVKYYKGIDGVMNLYNDTWRNNEKKIIYAITDYEKAYKTVGDTFLRDNYFKQRVRHGVTVKSLLPESPIGKKEMDTAKELLRDMRFIDLFEDLGIEINIYDNKVAVFAFDDEPSGILIQNDLIARAFKNIFSYLWKNVELND